jgi:hypothetical protein
MPQPVVADPMQLEAAQLGGQPEVPRNRHIDTTIVVFASPIRILPLEFATQDLVFHGCTVEDLEITEGSAPRRPSPTHMM